MSKLFLPGKHFSFSDWLSTKDPTSGYATNIWQLDTTHYISSPSSSERDLLHNSLDYYASQVVKATVVGNIYEGQLDSYLRFMGGAGNRQCGFVVQHYGNVPSSANQVLVSTSSFDWQRFRITFWFTYDMENNPKLRVDLQQFVAGSWSSPTTFYFDRRESGTCRVGFYQLADAAVWTTTWRDDSFLYY